MVSNLGDAAVRRCMLFGNPDHPRCNESRNTVKHEGDQRGDEQMRKLAVNEFLGVIDPFIQHLAHKAAFREEARSDCQKISVHFNSPHYYLYCAQAGHPFGQ